MGYVDLITAAQKTLQGVDFKKLRAAYAASPLYAPYNMEESAILAKAREFSDKQDYRSAMLRIEQVLNSNFLNLHAHLAAKQVHQKTGETSAAGYHDQFIRGLIGALMSSGDGLSYATAFVVLNIGEEYIVLDVLGLKKDKQMLQEKDGSHFDTIVATDRNGATKTIYFNINWLKGLGQPIQQRERPTIVIGALEWTTSNLNVDRFRNGDPIPEASSVEDWKNAGRDGKPVWCYFKNNPGEAELVGKLYNWHAVNDPRGLAPDSWHIPNDEEWGMLVVYLGGKSLAGVKMKSVDYWKNFGHGTNESGFNGRPGGGRIYERYESDFAGTFDGLGMIGSWWSATETKQTHARLISCVGMSWGLAMIENAKAAGASVRCVRKIVAGNQNNGGVNDPVQGR